VLDLQANEIDRTHNQDTGNAQQQDLPAQAKMQPAKSPAGKFTAFSINLVRKGSTRSWQQCVKMQLP
jgi:hypothetical protein